jgi:hypothetical protein
VVPDERGELASFVSPARVPTVEAAMSITRTTLSAGAVIHREQGCVQATMESHSHKDKQLTTTQQSRCTMHSH